MPNNAMRLLIFLGGPIVRKQENTPTPGTGLSLCPNFRVEVAFWRRAATRNTRNAHAIGCLLWFSPNNCRNHVSITCPIWVHMARQRPYSNQKTPCHLWAGSCSDRSPPSGPNMSAKSQDVPTRSNSNIANFLWFQYVSLWWIEHTYSTVFCRSERG